MIAKIVTIIKKLIKDLSLIDRKGNEMIRLIYH